MQQLSDEELVAKFRSQGGSPKGDPLINELFSRYHARVATWCFRFTGDRNSAADLAQDIFLRAYRYLDSFRGDSKFSTWLYSISRNHCVNEMKSRAVRPEQALDDLPGEPEDEQHRDVLSALESEEAQRSLRALMDELLDETEKKVMVLHFGEELTLDSITRLLGLRNTSGARAYVMSAKRKLNTGFQRLKKMGRV
jgi:RNA polymerase sigma-70 factor, ECF subfamily